MLQRLDEDAQFFHFVKIFFRGSLAEHPINDLQSLLREFGEAFLRGFLDILRVENIFNEGLRGFEPLFDLAVNFVGVVEEAFAQRGEGFFFLACRRVDSAREFLKEEVIHPLPRHADEGLTPLFRGRFDNQIEEFFAGERISRILKRFRRGFEFSRRGLEFSSEFGFFEELLFDEAHPLHDLLLSGGGCGLNQLPEKSEEFFVHERGVFFQDDAPHVVGGGGNEFFDEVYALLL